MAKVRFPLWSLSASGSIGETINYQQAGETQRRVDSKARQGEFFEAQYPPRVITGRGIVRQKPGKRRDLRRATAQDGETPTSQQGIFQAQFSYISALTQWVVRHNIIFFHFNSPPPTGQLYPWWDEYYTQQEETRELRKFPGQPKGETLAIRRTIPARLTKHGYIFRQLIGKTNIRIRLGLQAWLNIDERARRGWTIGGSPDVGTLPGYTLAPGSSFEKRQFSAYYLESVYLINHYNILPRWQENGTTGGLINALDIRPPGDPVRRRFEEFISQENDYRRVQVTSWGPSEKS